MAKYTFSQGKVAVEEGIYLPVPHKDRRLARVGVLIVIPPHTDVKEQPESTITRDKEFPHDRQS